MKIYLARKAGKPTFYDFSPKTVARDQGHSDPETIYDTMLPQGVSENQILDSFHDTFQRIAKKLIRLRICAGWFAPLLFLNPRRQVFSHRGPYNIGFMVLHLRAELTCKGFEMSRYEGLCNYFVSSNGHQWNRLVSDLHKKAFADCIINNN